MISDEDVPALAAAMERVNKAGGSEPFVKADGGSWHDWSEHARRIVFEAQGRDWREAADDE